MSILCSYSQTNYGFTPSTNRTHLLELLAPLEQPENLLQSWVARTAKIRLYPFQSPPADTVVGGSSSLNDIAALSETVIADMDAFRNEQFQNVTDLVYYLPSVKSKHSDLGKMSYIQIYSV